MKQTKSTTGGAVIDPAVFLTHDDVCSRLQISRRTAVTWRKQGILPSIKLNRAVRFFWPDVQSALLRRQTGRLV